MAFEGLSSKLQNIFRKLGGKGKLTEKEVKEAMREIKLALLEADVNFSVVKSFISTVSARAVGSDVLQSLTPSQQIIKIVNEELTQLIGGSVVKVEFGPRKPSVFLLAGLQGAGKTTMAGKLAAYLAKDSGQKTAACCMRRAMALPRSPSFRSWVKRSMFPSSNAGRRIPLKPQRKRLNMLPATSTILL